MDSNTPSVQIPTRTQSPRPSKTMDPSFPAYPQAITINPSHSHQQTFIILHGRGSFAEKFAPPLLHMTTTEGKTLQTAFPHAKLIFPTASRTRATIYKKSFTHQWFDCWHLDACTKRHDLMREGLGRSCAYVHFLLQREMEIVGARNVVLWGMSQGCATGLAAVVTWEGEPFAGMVGMCGWLPFGNLVEEMVGGGGWGARDGDGDYADEDPFARSDDEDEDAPYARSDEEDSSEKKACIDSRARGVEFFREEIDMQDKEGMVFRKIPIFLGHGTEDEKVSMELGREAERVLGLLGADVEMKEYVKLGHWYSEAMFDDIFRFLKQKLNIS
ncbi:acyl- thioesterase protein [Rutstroemia sp. NJR-2017a BVV2]|nr:acyl- thioesterase protein [Rutstroemia sp. NJR-2017a BVV2]